MDITKAMYEWGFIGQDSLVGIGKSATIYKFKQTCGYVRDEGLVHSNPHSSQLGVTFIYQMNAYYQIVGLIIAFFVAGFMLWWDFFKLA